MGLMEKLALSYFWIKISGYRANIFAEKLLSENTFLQKMTWNFQ
jgi:hypothetical protein